MAGLVVGLIAGLLGGLVGVGGGVVVVPLMTDVLKFKQQEAHGTSLVTVVVTAAAGSLVYYLHGSAELPAAAVLAGMALCTIRLGARYCCFLPESKLKRYFGTFLLFISLLAMIPASTVGVWTHWKMGNVRTAVLPGLIVGVLAGVFLGGSIAHLIPEMELRLVYAVLLVCMAVRYLWTKPNCGPV